MNAHPPRKPPTSTAREVADLRRYHAHDPDTYALPLASALATLSREYRFAENPVAARRHIDASVKVMREAARAGRIPDHAQRHIVDFLRASSSLHVSQGQWPQARAALEEALNWDAFTWEAHAFCLGYRELSRAHMLRTLALVLDALDRIDEASDVRAEAVLVALSDTDSEPDDMTTLVAELATDIALSQGYAQA